MYIFAEFFIRQPSKRSASLIEALDDGAHVLGDALHDLGRLDPRRHRVHLARHAEVVEALALLPDGILSVDPGRLLVSLLQGLPHLYREFKRPLSLKLFIRSFPKNYLLLVGPLLLLGLLAQSVQLLRAELQLEQAL